MLTLRFVVGTIPLDISYVWAIVYMQRNWHDARGSSTWEADFTSEICSEQLRRSGLENAISDRL